MSLEPEQTSFNLKGLHRATVEMCQLVAISFRPDLHIVNNQIFWFAFIKGLIKHKALIQQK